MEVGLHHHRGQRRLWKVREALGEADMAPVPLEMALGVHLDLLQPSCHPTLNSYGFLQNKLNTRPNPTPPPV